LIENAKGIVNKGKPGCSMMYSMNPYQDANMDVFTAPGTYMNIGVIVPALILNEK
jgi:hypothetical protein